MSGAPGGFQRRRLRLSSVLLLSVLLASAAFSYALATSGASPETAARARQAAAQARFLGQPLRFTNPFLPAGTDYQYPLGGMISLDPQGFDLGDACHGSAITRYITAAGGYMPYTFLLKPLLGSQSSDGGNPSPSLPLLSPGGILSGAMPGDVGSFVRFNVQLTDFIGTQRLGLFRLNVLPGDQPPFRFAQDQLPIAQQNNNYFTKIETLGPAGTFSVVPGSVTVTAGKAAAQALNQLEDAGLTLAAEDGVLYGRPTKAADITFTARATDPATQQNALNRAGKGQDQQFTIKVETGGPVTSELAGVRCALRGSTTTTGADGLTYAGFLDTRGLTAANLAGTTLTLRLGGARFTGEFDAKGRINKVLPAGTDAGTSADTSGTKAKTAKHLLSVALSPSNGRLKIKLTGVDLASKLNVPLNDPAHPINRTFQTLVIGLDLGAFRTCEVLRMETRALANGTFAMDYTLGTHGFSRAGSCQILSVIGVDPAIKGKTPPAGDRWLVRLLGVPGQDMETTTPTTTPTTVTTSGTKAPAFQKPLAGQAITGGSVTIRVGDFKQDVSVAKQSVRYVFKATSKDAGIYKLLVDPTKFLHRLETNVLGSNDTGIPAAVSTKDLTVFPLGVTAGTYKGETGRVIYPERGAWRQR
ncbi:MAG: hypothetical protein NTW87_18990 [Planctomycetota bacterium]|nr:hypothetical protein [Planctomycetota bacterium]